MNTAREQTYTKTYKFVLFGDSGVGRTSLLLRHADATFNESLKGSIGKNYKTTQMAFDKKIINLLTVEEMLDYNPGLNHNITNFHVAIVVFDLTNKASFTGAIKKIIEIKERFGEKAKIILVGSKCDLTEKRAVSEEDIKGLMKLNPHSALDFKNKFPSNAHPDNLKLSADEMLY